MKASPQGLYQHDEEGLQGIAIDPDFEENRWVYLYYSPRLNTPTDVVGTGINEGDAPENLTTDDRQRLALFDGSACCRGSSSNDTGSGGNQRARFLERAGAFRVPQDRGLCCHVGGQIDFDYGGNLFLSTGDDTNPFQSAGYTPIDDRATRNPAFDARRTSGNTNDLRGKLLRIRLMDEDAIEDDHDPGRGRSYRIPAGNMFGRNQALTRPEIYAMGFRNPFRFAVDRVAATSISAIIRRMRRWRTRRVGRRVGRWMMVRGGELWLAVLHDAGPAVRDYDFTPDAPQSGDEFNCFGPTNDSRNNTGLRTLPQVERPEVWYSYPGRDEGCSRSF